MTSRFRRERIFRAASLSGLAAFFVAGTIGCAGGGAGPVGDEPEARTSPRPAWVDGPPAECAVGASGPTLNPRNAIRRARAAAIDALAVGELPVDVQTITGSGSDGEFLLSSQSVSGILSDARIVALWADTATTGSIRGRVRQVHALACWPTASLRGIPPPDYPRWLLDPEIGPDRICATGIAGPTWRAEDQAESALRDARLALAIALESRIDKRIFDDGRGVVDMVKQVEPSPAALARAARAESLDRDWLDEEGRGPIGLPGVLYGLVCIDG